MAMSHGQGATQYCAFLAKDVLTMLATGIAPATARGRDQGDRTHTAIMLAATRLLGIAPATARSCDQGDPPTGHCPDHSAKLQPG